MDRLLPEPPAWRRRAPWIAAVLVPAVLAGALAWQRTPQRTRVLAPQLATVRAGEFRDELALRAQAAPLRSVQLDAPEAGRVEEVLAHDGDPVPEGAPLYRLRSPEQEQLLMQRSAEVAQQMANVSVQRSAQAATRAQDRRALAQLEADAGQAEDDWTRQARLASEGFVSPAAVEQAARRRDLAARLLRQAREDAQADDRIQAQSLAEMAQAVSGLQHGLRLLEGARERLLQRAPIAGRLAGFQLQVGASVHVGDRLGRIDDLAGGVQLVAEVDEYWLARLRPGLPAASAAGPLRLAQTLPQVEGGKVKVLLRWAEGIAPPALQPGQAVDLRLELSPPAPALLLPDGPGVQSRLYVRQGGELQARSVRLGRRAAGQVEVLAGLRAGDEVLVSQPPSEAERLALP